MPHEPSMGKIFMLLVIGYVALAAYVLWSQKRMKGEIGELRHNLLSPGTRVDWQGPDQPTKCDFDGEFQSDLFL